MTSTAAAGRRLRTSLDLRVSVLAILCLASGLFALHHYVRVGRDEAVTLQQTALVWAAALAAAELDPAVVSAGANDAARAHAAREMEKVRGVLSLPPGSVRLGGPPSDSPRAVLEGGAALALPAVTRGKLAALYATALPQVTDPQPGPSGPEITALAPIVSAKGQVLGHVQIAMPVNAFSGRMSHRLAIWANGARAGLVLAVLLTLVLVARLTGPVHRVERLLAEIARGSGDLTQRLPVSGKDAAARLAGSFNEFIAMTEVLIGRVLGSAQSVGSASKRLQDAAASQVQAAAAQASVVARTTRTLDDLVRTFQSTASRAEGVAREAEEALGVASEGLGQIEGIVTQMDQIKASSIETIQETYALVERSHEIGQVMALINDIAAKTKLIAFNAAIEASAAGGDAGRRFSVVAQEVRRLAERVVKSTGAIEGMIKDIQGRVQRLIARTEESFRKVEEGHQVSRSAVSAMQRIAVSAERTADVAKAIGATARTQGTAGGQLLHDLTEIQDDTQQFRDSILDMKATADELDRLFVDLLAEIRTFRVAET